MAFSQSDRPCAAPFFPLGNCASTIPLVLAGNSFQAGDAPIPAACNLGYSVDVWTRVIAPSSDFTLSLITRTYGFAGNPEDPGQMNVLFYEESPDCNNLFNPIGCQPLCFLGQVCISIDGMEGSAVARRFIGLVPGNLYYMRTLWNPSSTPAPDSVRINLSSFVCASCDPCIGIDIPLDHQALQLNGHSRQGHIALSWEAEGANMDAFTIQRSLNSMDWESHSLSLKTDGNVWSANDYDVQVGQPYFYRVQQQIENGAVLNSEVVEVTVGTQDAMAIGWLKGLEVNETAMVLQIDLEADAMLKVYDLQGKLLFEKSLDQNESELSIPKSKLAKGLLMLSLTGSRQSDTQLIRAWN